MSLEDGEDYKCDKEGYFDLDSLKPYSSVWVSTRRDGKSKTFQQEEEFDPKKNVMPSRACNDLHSLLETNDLESTGEDYNQAKPHLQQLSSTKSDHFPLNSYKLYDKSEGFSLRKISDKIIGSMCKSESKIGDNYSSPGSSTDCVSQKKSLDKCSQQIHEPVKEAERQKSNIEVEETEEQNSKKYPKKTDEEIPTEKIMREHSLTSHLGGGDPQEDLKKPKILSDNGKLITEMSITSMNVKDHAGKEFPVTVKYVWEVDPNEVMNAHENVFHSSPAFMKIVESVSSVGIKIEKPVSENITTKTAPSWQDKSKSQTNCIQRNRRFESWNNEDKENESNHNVNNKGDGPLRKGIGNSQAIKNTILRSKISVAGPHQDKKFLDHNDKKETRIAESGPRDGSKINIGDKKSNLDRKSRVPIKKKLPTVDELKVPNALARPATFNKRDIVQKPSATRPPSAPTREPRLSHRIGVQDSGDRLTQSFNKRPPFGSSKFQSPPADASSKCWK